MCSGLILLQIYLSTCIYQRKFLCAGCHTLLRCLNFFVASLQTMKMVRVHSRSRSCAWPALHCRRRCDILNLRLAFCSLGTLSRLIRRVQLLVLRHGAACTSYSREEGVVSARPVFVFYERETWGLGSLHWCVRLTLRGFLAPTRRRVNLNYCIYVYYIYIYICTHMCCVQTSCTSWTSCTSCTSESRDTITTYITCVCRCEQGQRSKTHELPLRALSDVYIGCRHDIFQVGIARDLPPDTCFSIVARVRTLLVTSSLFFSFYWLCVCCVVADICLKRYFCVFRCSYVVHRLQSPCQHCKSTSAQQLAGWHQSCFQEQGDARAAKFHH